MSLTSMMTSYLLPFSGTSYEINIKFLIFNNIKKVLLVHLIWTCVTLFLWVFPLPLYQEKMENKIQIIVSAELEVVVFTYSRRER